MCALGAAVFDNPLPLVDHKWNGKTSNTRRNNYRMCMSSFHMSLLEQRCIPCMKTIQHEVEVLEHCGTEACSDRLSFSVSVGLVL